MLKSELFPEETTITPANAPKRIRGSSLKDKILSQKPKEHLVKLTNPTQGLELKSNPETLAKTKKLMEQAGMLKKAKEYSAPIDAFLVSADGRITTTKISMDTAPILKSYGVVVVPACGISMLSYKLSQQFNGKDVSLAQMLKCSEFKDQYNKLK
ncbi:hypothetical protein [Pseudomonas sp. PLB05]|uniref:hypothetical protein n=1 Tax=Pseudomonas sp. PLB05 TaxID=2899078 RepID=UPI001E5DC1A6|nr:hypothetical protein [Pseudomonas sp. PLB05]MCD4863795.1 hypothetical protein [Pseudomonas sp. PLB05]